MNVDELFTNQIFKGELFDLTTEAQRIQRFNFQTQSLSSALKRGVSPPPRPFLIAIFITFEASEVSL